MSHTLRNICRLCSIVALCIVWQSAADAQTFKNRYSDFQKQAQKKYSSFRDECNEKYIGFLKTAWSRYESKEPIPLPGEHPPVPPVPYIKNNGSKPVVTKPTVISPVAPKPQPTPVAPVPEVHNPVVTGFTVRFYGITTDVRLPESANMLLKDCRPSTIASAWEKLSANDMNNAIRDCLETRIRYSLPDWAFLLFLDSLGKQFCGDNNSATLLTAFLFCQCGYQMRLAVDSAGKLILLYGSRHQIYNKRYFIVGGIRFYPFGNYPDSLSICDAVFHGERPLSLLIDKEPILGSGMTPIRRMKSRRYDEFDFKSQVPKHLIDFYNDYPTSAIDGNYMTRWAMYANAPLSQKTKDLLYPPLIAAIKGLSKKDAAEKILNWVQTAFVYKSDDKVWGHDRAFFAEETLYYPYSDCEDRSILFSILVRDLLGLDVALVYYPGHLATAVCFDTDVSGDTMIIGNRRFVVCDPTYVGAPVGARMPGLEYEKAESILLNR